ncbi:MAG: DUF4124 domain-containing protein [Rhodanobacter sp.]|nr:MAG: DUF4124 domain-containing protein [Rhodanobacter sp.]
MRRLTTLLCLTLIAGSGSAAAQTTIHHCLGADGDPVFTDQPCASLDATPVRPVGARRQAASPARPTPILCPANRQALQQGVIVAFADHDANRLAGLMLWNGVGRDAAVADVRSLATLMQQPLLGFGPATDQEVASPSSSLPGGTADPAPPAPAGPPPPVKQLIVRTAGHDDETAPAIYFNIVQQAGCLWLRRAD